MNYDDIVPLDLISNPVFSISPILEIDPCTNGSLRSNMFFNSNSFDILTHGASNIKKDIPQDEAEKEAWQKSNDEKETINQKECIGCDVQKHLLNEGKKSNCGSPINVVHVEKDKPSKFLFKLTKNPGKRDFCKPTSNYEGTKHNLASKSMFLSTTTSLTAKPEANVNDSISDLISKVHLNTATLFRMREIKKKINTATR